MIIIIADVDEVAALLDLSDKRREPEIIRPQTSGPCVHYDEDEDGHCAYPHDQPCPHLDNPDVLCPVKDSLYAMREVARMRGVCEAEQEGGQCEYYDERSDVEPCTYPYEWGCPHLDDPAIICPGKDERSAETERIEQDLAWAWGDDLPEFVSLAQDPEGWGRDMAADPADQVPRSDYVLAPRDPQEQDADMAAVAPSQTYETAEPEFVEPEPDEDHAYAIQLPTPAKRKNAWTEDENWTVARADTRAEAIEAYRAAYPDSTRTDKAILSRWEKLHRDCREPLAPDFAGDQVPVTQCDEAAIRRPRFKAGDRVRISHPAFKGYTGTIRRYYAATANYLTHIDGTTDTMWLSEEYLEAA